MRLRSKGIGILSALLVAGCWGGGDDSDSDSDSFDPLPPVEQSLPTVAEPRDLAAVEDAARRIDPCVLLKKARAQVDSRHLAKADVLDHAGAFACTSRGVSVRVGEDFVASHFVASRSVSPTRIAGAVAFTDIEITDECSTELPIDPGQAVTVTAHSSIPLAQRCALATNLAQAVGRIMRANPDSSIGNPPLRWSRCELLRRALPASQRDAPLTAEIDLDGCFVQSAERHSIAVKTSVFVERGRQLTIDGRSVYRFRERGTCTYAWDDRRVTPTAALRGISVAHPRCEQAKQMARRTMQTLRSQPPQSPPRQQPLTYPLSDNDLSKDCAYLPFDNPSDCNSSLSADVPSDAVDLIRHAEADPEVSCALAHDVVLQRFPVQPFAVAATRGSTRRNPGCSFSDTTNSVQVWVDASTEPAGTDSGAETGLTVDGHPAQITKKPGEVTLAVAHDGLDEPGQLIGTIVTPPGSPDLDKHADDLEKLMTDLAEEHL